MTTLVLYHDRCSDGFCAAWAAYRRFGSNAEYLPVQYGQDPPDVAGRNVYILDFSYSADATRRLASLNNHVTILDHHVIAQAELAALASDDYWRPKLTVVFDMDRSGGRLAWEHFHPGKPAPWLVDYTEDRDMWRWKLRHSRAVSASLASYPHDFVLWDEFAVYGQYPPESLIAGGGAILRYQQQHGTFAAAGRSI